MCSCDLNGDSTESTAGGDKEGFAILATEDNISRTEVVHDQLQLSSVDWNAVNPGHIDLSVYPLGPMYTAVSAPAQV